jgi:phage FluMu protein Com
MIYNEKAHAEKIAANRAAKLEKLHGTVAGYDYYKCRCPRCTLANARRKAAYRAAKMAGAVEHAQRLRLVKKQREDERKIW